MVVSFGTAVAAQVVEVAGDAVAQRLVDASRAISDLANCVQVNKDLTLALSRRVDELLTVVTALLEVPPVTDDRVPGLDQLESILVDTKLLLDGLRDQSYVTQLLYKDRNAQKLVDMSERVRHARDTFALEARIDLQRSVCDRMDAAQARASKLLPDVVDVAPLLPASRLPPSPLLYLGRSRETQTVVNVLAADAPAYIAVLGAPGMGKTSVATAVLYAPAVVARFGSRRFFVACDAVDGRSSCLTIICAAFGIAKAGRRAASAALGDILGAAPSLLVLDNFESAWEAADSRTEAEETLEILASTKGLSLVVTMRGAERPLGVPWTRPVLPPLHSLADDAAKQLFLSISDVSEQNPHLGELLEPLDNIPLPLVLMANLAQYESSLELLERWHGIKTAMLRRGGGDGRLTSLDFSIELSLSSPRVQQHPGATTMLSLLSLLPQGAMDTDISLFASDQSARSVSQCLLRTALAYRTHDDRVRVLAPIREFMLVNHPPAGVDADRLYNHYFALTDVIVDPKKGRSSPEAVAIISAELDNVSFVLHYALDHASDTAAAVKAARAMIWLFSDTGVGSAGMLQHALSTARRHDLDDLVAELLLVWAWLAYQCVVPGDVRLLFEESRTLSLKTGHHRRAIDCTLRLVNYMSVAEGLTACADMLVMSEGIQDPQRVGLCHQTMACMYERAGRMDDALLSHQRASEVLRPLGSPGRPMLCYSMSRLAHFDVNNGRMRSGIAAFEEVVALLKEARRWLGLAETYRTLGYLHLQTGETSQAAEFLGLAIDTYRSISNTRGELEVLETLVVVHLTDNDLCSAQEAASKASLLLPSSGDGGSSETATFLRLHGKILHRSGNLADARAALHGSIAASREPDTIRNSEQRQTDEAYSLVVLGRVEQDDNRPADAYACFTLAALIFRRGSVQSGVLEALTRFAVATEDDTLSENLLDAVMLPLQRYEFRPLLAEAVLRFSSIALERGKTSAAGHRARRALTHFEETKDHPGAARANVVLQECS